MPKTPWIQARIWGFIIDYKHVALLRLARFVMFFEPVTHMLVIFPHVNRAGVDSNTPF